MKDLAKYNIGWAFLKLFMCFEVVLVHCWSLSVYPNGTPPPGCGLLVLFRAYAVPVFMPIAFFLSARRFEGCDGAWLKKRFERLVLPFAFWSLLAFVTWRCLAPWFPGFCIDPATGAFWTEACPNAPAPVGFEYLWLQLLLGTTRTLGSQMWFQAVLIVLTALFAVFFRWVRPAWVTAGLVALFLMGVMADYSGLNRWLFEGFRYEVRNPLGRILPMLPYATAGLLLGLRSHGTASLGLAHRWFLVAVGAAIAAFFLTFDVFLAAPGFYYSGLKMLVVAFGLVLAFYYLPTGRIPLCVRRAVVWLSEYSMGIYFTHIYIGHLLEKLVYPHVGILPRSMTGACVVFCASLAVCWLISLVPNRRVRALVT